MFHRIKSEPEQTEQQDEQVNEQVSEATITQTAQEASEQLSMMDAPVSTLSTQTAEALDTDVQASESEEGTPAKPETALDETTQEADADVQPETEQAPEAVLPKYKTRPVSRYAMASARTSSYTKTTTTNTQEDVNMTTTPETPETTPANPYARTASSYAAKTTYAAPTRTTTAVAPAADGDRTLTIGSGITMSGEIESCDYLVVEGTVEAALKGARSLEISETGTFYGTVEIEDATIAGRFEGDITAFGRLTITSSGVVTGSITYSELALEAGAILDGRLSPIAAQAAPQAQQPAAPRKPAAKQTSAEVAQEPANTDGGLFESGATAAE